MKVNDRMVWIEVATSGPEPETDRLERIAVVVTDKELELVAELPATQVEDAKASEAAALEVVRANVAEGKGLLAGTEVLRVRMFLAAHMPELFGYLHYRNVDLSTLRALVRSWYPDAWASRPTASEGIAGAIDELRYYRAKVFAETAHPTAEESASEEDEAP